MKRLRTKNTYILELASLPYLPPVDRVNKLPIVEAKIHKRLESIARDEFQFANNIVLYTLEEQGRSLDEHFVEFENVFNSLPSKLLEEIFCEVYGLHIYFRFLNAKIVDFDLSLDYPFVKDKLLHKFAYWDTCKFSKQAKKHLQAHEHLHAYLILYTKIWSTLDKYNSQNLFNLEGLYIYLLKWNILNNWLIAHNEQAVETAIKDLSGVDYDR